MAEEQGDSGLMPPMEPRFVNKGLRAPAMCPADPQVFLHRSNHPYSPFVGNALTWESWVFDDGTSYEGLTREYAPHGKGVITMGYDGGGAIQESSYGDSYEGEFQSGFAHGLGQHISPSTGDVYRGEYYAGKRQGCGMLANYSPFLNLVNDGVPMDEAWEQSKSKIRSRTKYGTWKKDFFVAEPDEQGQRYCHINEIKCDKKISRSLQLNDPPCLRGTLEEVESVLTQARMFKWKPGGYATHLKAQDANGLPLNLFQDPLHYPQGTKFMAPGPMGQCHEAPEDENLMNELVRHAANYQRIYDMYNFDYDPPPGSNQYKATEYIRQLREKMEKKEEDKAAKTASARAKKKKSPKSGKSPASVTVELAERVGTVVGQIGDSLKDICRGAPFFGPNCRR